MHVLACHPFTCVRLKWSIETRGDMFDLIRQLRGALGTQFAEADLLHQHMPNGKFAYRYPRVQYRWEDGAGLVFGWETAAAVLSDLPWLDVSARFGGRNAQVEEAVIAVGTGEFSVIDRLVRYRLLTPVLLFNQENYRKYRELPTNERDTECDRLLVAQILTALRGMDILFPERLYAAFVTRKTRVRTYKGQSLLGIEGTIVTNAGLPNGFGIGHAVSHGYGWMQKV